MKVNVQLKKWHLGLEPNKLVKKNAIFMNFQNRYLIKNANEATCAYFSSSKIKLNVLKSNSFNKL
jgi:hypothetical protein